MKTLHTPGNDRASAEPRLGILRETAEQVALAISGDEIDALVVGTSGKERIFTIGGADECYRTFVEMMRQGAVTIAPDGMILYGNRYFAELIKRPVEGLPGTSIFDFIAPEDHGLFRAMLWEAASRSDVKSQFHLQAHDGALIAASMTATPLTCAGVASVCLLINDLTEHDARVAAEAASAAKDRFLALLSHELRTPLTPVIMAIDHIEMHPELPRDVRHDVAMIRRNIELETRLIDDLLDLSRVINGKMRLQTQHLSVHTLVHGILDMLKPDILEKHLTVHTELIAADDTIKADPARLQQVLWNIVRNAIKFSHENGVITVRSMNPEPAAICVEVLDNGAGIAPETLPKIFAAFEQGESVLAQRTGLGLGLSIAKALVDAHGGRIWAQSAGVGRGATFSLVFALSTASSPAPANDAQPASGPRTASPPLRVLLVEDHVDTATALGKFLQRMGHRVSIATTVASALQHIAESTFELVISDIGLPDGTGYDLMKQIHQSCQTPGIALTGYGMEEDVRHSTEAGFAEHVTKPIAVEHLENVIARVTRNSAGAV